VRDVDRSSEDDALRLDPNESPEQARELEAVVSLLRSLPDPEPHSDLTARVMARVLEIEDQQSRQYRTHWIPTSRVAAALAASVAIVAVGIGIRQSLAPVGEPAALLAFQPAPTPTRAADAARRDPTRGFSIASAYPGSRAPAFFVRSVPEPALQGVPQMAAPVNLFDQHLDAQLNELQLDPYAFFRRLERVQDRERFIQRLAERAARRGDAAQVGLSVRTVPHRLAEPMVEQFLQASLVRQVATRR
jgi:hypothetical protein